jgi:hypothetical protein
LKELNEIAPVLDRVVNELNSPLYECKCTTIIDLCSGSGYFGMFIAELIPPAKLERICLVDNAWPSFGKQPQPHHINNGHILDTDWPTPVHCVKTDLKKPNHIRNLKKQLVDRAQGPIILTAVHLCGVLSIRAVQLFNDCSKIQMLTLKPCCLPPLHYITLNAPKSGMPIKEWLVAKRGGRPAYAIPAVEVCSAGKWVKKQWEGPPRRHIRLKFEKWAAHLMAAVDVEGLVVGDGRAIDSTEGLVVGDGRAIDSTTKPSTIDSTEDGSIKTLENIRVQQDHWQNLFIFAHRSQGCCRQCISQSAGAGSGVLLIEGRIVVELQRQLALLKRKNVNLRSSSVNNQSS